MFLMTTVTILPITSQPGDPCPQNCGGHLEEKRIEGTLWLQCSQHPDEHYVLADVDGPQDDHVSSLLGLG